MSTSTVLDGVLSEMTDRCDGLELITSLFGFLNSLHYSEMSDVEIISCAKRPDCLATCPPPRSPPRRFTTELCVYNGSLRALFFWALHTSDKRDQRVKDMHAWTIIMSFLAENEL